MKKFAITVCHWIIAIGYLLMLFAVGYARILWSVGCEYIGKLFKALGESQRRKRQRWMQFYPQPNHGKVFTGPYMEMDADGFVQPPAQRQQPQLFVVAGQALSEQSPERTQRAPAVISPNAPTKPPLRLVPPVQSPLAPPASRQPRLVPPDPWFEPVTHRSQPTWPAARVPSAPKLVHHKPAPAVAKVLQFPQDPQRAARLQAKRADAASQDE